MEGGNLLRGKTSDVELDSIYRHYLPPGLVLRCNTLPLLDHKKVGHIKQRLQSQGILYFPLFIKQHWIAGILRYNNQEGFTLTTHDSAPSHYVYLELEDRLAQFWPDLHIVQGKCTRQKRGSEDCGIHMTAIFFSTYLNEPIIGGDTIASRLRPFLAQASRIQIERDTFLKDIRKILKNSTYEGGAPTNPTLNERPRRRQRTEPRLHDNADNENSLGYSIDNKIHNTMAHASRVERAAAQRHLCYMLTATALANVGDGGNRSLEVNALAMQASRRNFKPSTQYDVGETLAVLGKELDFMTCEPNEHNPQLLYRARRPDAAWFVQSSDTSGLPLTLDSHTFRMGAKYSGSMVRHTLGVSAGIEGHYTLTTNPTEAIIGVYLPTEMTHYTTIHTPRVPMNSIQVDAPPQSSCKPRIATPRVSDTIDLEQVLHDPIPAGLNSVGLRPEGGTTSPEAWYVYQDRPSFVQKTAWEAKSKATRQLHIRWLNEIKAMPREFLDRDLPQAIMEYVRWIAVKRRWKWGTYAKNLTSIESALANLPMYTNQKKGISLKDYPEWRENLAGAQLKDKESEAEPPTPINIQSFQTIRRQLELSHPVEALFLTMMWMFAARPADISRLRVRDVTFSPSDTPGLIPTQLTIREGKAVKFRGPYPIASILPEKYASLLQQLMNQKTRKQKIFEQAENIRTRVLAEVQRAIPTATLSSLRKGAAMHLASKGVPEEELMRLTGHTQLQTLRRYLQYGLQPTAEDVTVQGNALLLLPAQNSLATRPPQQEN